MVGRVNGGTDAAQSFDRDPVPNRLVAHPDGPQVPSTHDPVLLRQQLSEQHIRMIACQLFLPL
jgi:hypothetical protein